MAKTYAAELLIKNKNAINSLEQVQKKVKSLQKELKKPIEVDAKLGSGFKNIETKINKVAPKKKTIQIEATENVTKTMSNVERKMFESTNKLNAKLSTAMKGFNSNISATLPKLNKLADVMSKVNSMNDVANAVKGSALTGAGVGLAGATLLKGTGSDKYMDPLQQKRIEKLVKQYRKYKSSDWGLRDIFYKGYLSTSDEGFRQDTKGTNDSLKNWHNDKNIFDGISEIDSVGFKKWAERFNDPSKLRVVDTAYGNLIRRQQEKMKKLGDANYLGNFKSLRSSSMDYGVYDTRQANGDITRIDKVKDKWSKAIRQMNQNAKFKLAYALYPLQQKAAKVFDFVELHGTKAWFKLERGVFKIGAAFGTVKRAISNMTPEIIKSSSKIPEFFSRAFTKVEKDSDGKAKRVKRDWVVQAQKIASTITSTIGKAFNKVVSIAKTAAGTIGTAMAGALGLGITDMASQEQNLISMVHFLGVGKAKKDGSYDHSDPTQKASTIKEAEAYLGKLTNLGNNTPFQNADVYDAGRRLLQVADGNTDFAYQITQLAADMAALTPGKTMSDAAEALADLAVGETERMKEFGFKLSQDELKALAGVPDQEGTLSQEQTMKALKQLTGENGELTKTFGNGANALSESLSGKFSTVIGKARQMLVDALKPFESDFKAILDKALAYIDGDFGAKFKDTLGTVFKGVKDILTGNKESDIPMVGSILRAFERLKSALSPIIDNIKSKFGEAGINFDTVGKFIENAIGGISTAIEAISPIINGFINIATWLFNAFAEHPALFTAIGAAIGGLTVLSTIVGIVTGAIGIFNTMTTIINGVKAAFTLLNVLGLGPVALGIAAVIGVGTLLITNWQNICTWASSVKDYALNLWETFKQNPLDAVNKVLGDMVGWLQSCVEWFGKLISKVAEWGKTKIVNPIKNFFSGGDKGSQNAYGKNRVPYDGYQASLHEGERILTSRQATQMDAGLLPGQSGGSNNNITINVSGTTDPDTTARMVVQRLKETLENTSVKSFA